MSYDRVKQSIDFRLFKVAHHDTSMTLCIQFLPAIIWNMSPSTIAEDTEAIDLEFLFAPSFDWSHNTDCASWNAVQGIVCIVESFNPKMSRQIFGL